MAFYSVHIMRPDGNTEHSNHSEATPREAAKKALAAYEKWIVKKIADADPGSEKRIWEQNRVPRFIEVVDKTGYVVEKFGAKDV
jgi:hypothetical protein